MGRLVKRRKMGAKRYDLLGELIKVMEPRGYTLDDINAAYIVLSTFENGIMELEDGTSVAVKDGKICGVGGHQTKSR